MASSPWDASYIDSTRGLLSLLNLSQPKSLVMQNLEDMDIDQMVEVPDTPPDRLATRSSNSVECIDINNNLSVIGRSGNLDSSGEGVLRRSQGRLMNGRGHNGTLRIRPPKELGHDKSEHHSSSAVDLSENSSSNRNAYMFRRFISDKLDSKHSNGVQHMDKGKDICSISPPRLANLRKSEAGQDLKEQNRLKAFRHGATEGPWVEERRAGTSAPNEHFWKGKEKMDDNAGAGAHIPHGNRINVSAGVQAETEKSKNVCQNSIASTRAAGRKSLVRNGCISPHNIARAKFSAEQSSVSKDSDCNGSGARNLASDSPFLKDRSVSSAEGSHFNMNKGKRVLLHPGRLKEVDARTQRTSNGTSLNLHSQKDISIRNVGRGEVGLFEGLGGWRTTRNRSKEVALSLSNEARSSSRVNNGVSRNNHGEVKVDGRRNRSNNHNEIEFEIPEIRDEVSSQRESALPIPRRAFNPVSESNQVSGRHNVSNTMTKRQRKQGSSSKSYCESSAMGLDDSEVVFLGSFGESSTSRSTTHQSADHPGIRNSVTTVHQSSPASRRSEADARARQLEADENLARELQEQLYQETPLYGGIEMDANIAQMLQVEADASWRASSIGNHPVVNTRGSLVGPVSRRSRSWSSQQPSGRRGGRARAPASSRMAQLRNRHRTQASSSIPRGRSVFPLEMALDTRIDILEALEAVFGDGSDTGTANHILQVQRDFNENDYEMLLALDESNHQNGAPVHQINSLPESVVQTDSFDETCAICLDTPALGDAIRHLPCLHKFHKDCIDPWLSRKTSCPVCKCSIT